LVKARIPSEGHLKSQPLVFVLLRLLTPRLVCVAAFSEVPSGWPIKRMNQVSAPLCKLERSFCSSGDGNSTVTGLLQCLAAQSIQARKLACKKARRFLLHENSAVQLASGAKQLSTRFASFSLGTRSLPIGGRLFLESDNETCFERQIDHGT
jgi:hypothetical protein